MVTQKEPTLKLKEEIVIDETKREIRIETTKREIADWNKNKENYEARICTEHGTPFWAWKTMGCNLCSKCKGISAVNDLPWVEDENV